MEYTIAPRVPGQRPADNPDYDGLTFVYVFTTITTPWVTPPALGNVTVVVANNQGFVPGMTIAIQTAGYYQVVSTANLNQMTIQNLGHLGNAAPGTGLGALNITTTSLPGPKGDPGVQGIPGVAATVNVGSTTTSAPGQNANVVNSGTPAAAILQFTIPRGLTGPQGAQGSPGQAYSNTTTADFTAAASPTAQTLSLQSTTGLFAGVTLNINPIGYYQVQGVLSGTQVTVVNNGTPTNAAPGTVSPSGSAVLGTGPQGPPGNAATITAGNTATGAPGSQAAVTQRGTAQAAIFDFAIPAGANGATGTPGAAGAPGAPGAAATLNVGTTTTGAPGSAAQVNASGTPQAQIFNFVVPQGLAGAQGPAGTAGGQGPQGAAGAPGAAATVAAGTTSTSAPGTNASVANVGSPSAAIFNFAIPRGDVGSQGAVGPQGATGAASTVPGPAGPQGIAGESYPIGVILPYTSTTAPPTWMIANGSAISRTTYPDLFALCGTTFGAGDGSTTFNLPDLRGRTGIGAGTGAGLTARALAATGGEETHLLSTAEMPAHIHAIAGSGIQALQQTASGGGSYAFQAQALNTASTGGGGTHNTMPPFLVVAFIIKVSSGGGATAQAPIADTTQPGLLRTVSGLATDFIDGTNNSQPLQPVIWSVRLRSFNAIGNPTFEVDQRLAAGSSGAFLGAGTATVWAVDRWFVSKVAATGTVSVLTTTEGVPVPGTNFIITRNRVDIVCNGVQASLAAGEYCQITQAVEGTSFRELMSDVYSLSIFAKCTRAITFTARLTNSSGTLYTLSKLCQITTPNQWTLFTLPNLPLWPAAGTWSYLPGQSSYNIGIGLAAGSTYISPANDAWAAGNFVTGPGTSNFLSATGTLSLAFIQHEPGPLCTTPIDCPFTQNLDDCLRYFQKTYNYVDRPGTVTLNGHYASWQPTSNPALFVPVSFKRVMAKQPTVTIYNPNNGAPNSYYYNDSSATAVTAINGTGDSGYSGFTSAGAPVAGWWARWHHTADTGW